MRSQEYYGKVNLNDIVKLNAHRRNVADLFQLVDKDNDVTLYRDLDKVNEFWQAVDDEIE